MKFSIKNKKVWVAGSSGMVGSAIVRRLKTEDVKIITATRKDVDLLNSSEVEKFYKINAPDVVILAAAKVGGIHANNNYPAEFIYENLQIQQNVIAGAYKHGVKKLLFLGSSCIYPKESKQPIKEEYLLTGPLEPTNEWYAVAKIAGIKLCQAFRKQYGCDFISVMPSNLYGPNDNFHPTNSHVPAALLQRFHLAKVNKDKEVLVWGTGKAQREFLFVDDLADACIFLLKNYSDAEHVNVGTNDEVSIADFAKLIASIVGYSGKIVFDKTKPDGTLRKKLDLSKINSLGWENKIELKAGLQNYYNWYLKNIYEKN